METTSREEAVREQSFFRSPMFLVGNVLWLVVLGVLAGVWYREKLKQVERSNAAAVARQTSPDVDGGQSKSLVIKTNKDGSLDVVEGSKGAEESPWDKDGIADFEFIDQEGRTVTKADLLGKPWIVCFVFTHCAATCPMVTNSMRELQDRLKEVDFRLITLTVDPERDTPEVLKGYGEARGADFSKWKFLGGEQRAIYKLIHGSFKMPVKEMIGKDRQPGFEFIHSNNIMLVDAEGVVRGKYDATKGEAMSTLRREIQKLANKSTEAASEASESDKADAEKPENADAGR